MNPEASLHQEIKIILNTQVLKIENNPENQI